jgi:hypothetical protein
MKFTFRPCFTSNTRKFTESRLFYRTKGVDPLHRMLAVVRWYLASYTELAVSITQFMCKF